MLSFMCDLAVAAIQDCLALIEPLRKRRSPLVPKVHPAPTDNRLEHCQECEDHTVHTAYTWRLENVVTLECVRCGRAVEKS